MWPLHSRTPFGDNETVEACSLQPPPAVSEKGGTVEAWRQDEMPTQQLLLKRLYGGADREVLGCVARVQVKKRKMEGDCL